MDFLIPDWPAPDHVQARVTTRRGGVSAAPYASLNLGDHVGDDPAAVAANRAELRAYLPAEPLWLKQIHGCGIATADQVAGIPEADGSISRQAGRICAVLTADCLPVLFCDRAGMVVAAAHAGWRGLADGVLEAAVAAMVVEPGEILAWLGPAIGPQAFEVGEEVRQAFMAQDPAAASAFVPSPQTPHSPARPGKWLADIYSLARQRLARAGVKQVFGGDFCTYTDAERFYSYRRDGATGRMASLLWLDS
ncbi:MAG: peptidoglycan editing factor PgeF [Pseudomonadota bacterium]